MKFFIKIILFIVYFLTITFTNIAQETKKNTQKGRKLTTQSPISIDSKNNNSVKTLHKHSVFLNLKHKNVVNSAQIRHQKGDFHVDHSINKEHNYHYIAGKPIYTHNENKPIRKTLSYISKEQKNHNLIPSRLYTISKRPLDVQIEDRIHFGIGEHALSSLKIKEMETILNNVEEVIKKYKFVNPKDRVILILEIEGYTDKLSRETDPSIRQRKNQVLSEQRATLIGNYMQEQIKKRKLASKIHLHTKGLGEQLPPHYVVTDNQADNDPNRRICLVDVFVYSNRSTN